MGRGWRRAFCTTIPTDHPPTSNTDIPPLQPQMSSTTPASPTPPHTCAKLGFFSNPSTPRLRIRTSLPNSATPTLQCNTKTPRSNLASNPSSPRSPFAILKNTLRLSKNGCGVCMQSVKTGQGMAIYTAECSHAFHFPCIAAHVRKLGCLICPVCNITWKDVPLLAFHKNSHVSEEEENVVGKKTNLNKAVAASAPATPTGTNRSLFQDKRIQSNKRDYYNDDEPLLSPRFKPIPEVEETEDAGEFQGFCVTPKSSKPSSVDPYNSTNKRPPKNVEIKLLPEAAVVSGGRSYETYAVALRVKAPPTTDRILSPSHRAPIDLVTVLDVSGSMTGSKLQMLKRAMRLVVSSLGSADRLSIVAFASAPHRLLPLRRMTAQGQKAARKIIDQLACGQGTSVSEALRKAAKVLEDRREKNPVCSIILLSDGQDDYTTGGGNKNGSNTDRQRGSSTRFAHIEIPVLPSGFGFRTPEPQQDAFAKCVGGLLSVVVQDLRVQLGFASGSAPAEIMAVYSCNGRPGLMSSDSARLGDLYAEEEREVLVELKVPTSAIGAHHVMCVRCSYKDPVTGEVMYGRERALLVPRPHAVRSAEPRVERLRNLFIYTRAVAESRRLVDHGDYISAHHLISSARALVVQSASAEEYARGLEAELAHVHWRRQYHLQKEQEAATVVPQQTRSKELMDENGEPLTPTSAWRAAEKLAKVAMIKKSMNRCVSDLHGFENARF